MRQVVHRQLRGQFSTHCLAHLRRRLCEVLERSSLRVGLISWTTLRVSRGKALLGTFAPLKHKTDCCENQVSKSGNCGISRGAQGRYQSSSHVRPARKNAVGMTYSMTPVVRPLKVYHTIQASKRRPSTLPTMRIQLFLRKDVSTGLRYRVGLALTFCIAFVPNSGV